MSKEYRIRLGSSPQVVSYELGGKPYLVDRAIDHWQWIALLERLERLVEAVEKLNKGGEP